MAKSPVKAPVESDDKSEHPAICGLIMPISATQNHPEDHWNSVRQLLTRSIENAALQAIPVWINSSTDRVSERIVGNIFKFPIIVADISDLNPNVMLELGLRLASRKPTIIVMEEGGTILFDVRDIHIRMYPANLSILKMESFIEDLCVDIKEKIEASGNGSYKSFLDNVVVDVVSPGEKEVPLNQYVLDQLQELNRRVAAIDSSIPVRKPVAKSGPNDKIVSATGGGSTTFYVTTPSKQSANLERLLKDIDDIDEIRTLTSSGDETFFAIICNRNLSGSLMSQTSSAIDDVLSSVDGKAHVPRWIIDKYRHSN